MVYYRVANIRIRDHSLATGTGITALLNEYGRQVDAFIDSELRAHLGTFDADGNVIVLPFTLATIPALDEELLTHADDLTIAYLRADQNDKPELKIEAENKFRKDYMRKRFGFSRDLPYNITNLADVT